MPSSETEGLNISKRLNITTMYTTFLSRSVWRALLVALTLGGFLVTQPKMRSWGSFPIQAQLLTEFVTHTCHDPEFSPQRFWQFRESYSPGHFTPNAEVAQGSALVVLQKVTPPRTLLLNYYSNEIKSRESLISPTNLSEYLSAQGISTESEICRTPSFVFYQPLEGQLRFVFLAPLTSLYQTNGFLNYTAEERELIGDSIWLSESEITTPSNWKAP